MGSAAIFKSIYSIHFEYLDRLGAVPNWALPHFVSMMTKSNKFQKYRHVTCFIFVKLTCFSSCKNYVYKTCVLTSSRCRCRSPASKESTSTHWALSGQRVAARRWVCHQRHHRALRGLQPPRGFCFFLKQTLENHELNKIHISYTQLKNLQSGSHDFKGWYFKHLSHFFSGFHTKWMTPKFQSFWSKIPDFQEPFFKKWFVSQFGRKLRTFTGGSTLCRDVKVGLAKRVGKDVTPLTRWEQPTGCENPHSFAFMNGDGCFFFSNLRGQMLGNLRWMMWNWKMHETVQQNL